MRRRLSHPVPEDLRLRAPADRRARGLLQRLRIPRDEIEKRVIHAMQEHYTGVSVAAMYADAVENLAKPGKREELEAQQAEINRRLDNLRGALEEEDDAEERKFTRRRISDLKNERAAVLRAMPLAVDVDAAAFERAYSNLKEALQGDPHKAREVLAQLIDGRIRVVPDRYWVHPFDGQMHELPDPEQGYRLEWQPCWDWLVAGAGFQHLSPVWPLPWKLAA